MTKLIEKNLELGEEAAGRMTSIALLGLKAEALAVQGALTANQADDETNN